MEHNRIFLRPWTSQDLDDLFLYSQDEELAIQAGWLPPKNIGDSQYALEEIYKSWGFYAIVSKENNHVIGSVTLLIGESSNFSIPDTDGELSFWLGRPYWGQGIMAEAIELMLEFAFLDQELDVVWCGCFEENLRSRRLQEKCGFQFAYRIDQVNTFASRNKSECVMRMDFATYERIYLGD